VNYDLRPNWQFGDDFGVLIWFVAEIRHWRDDVVRFTPLDITVTTAGKQQ